MKKQNNNSVSQLKMINPDAAGIDIGSTFHYVCVPEDRDQSHIQKFSCFTEDLNEIANWLEKCKVKTVAMESTSVYWIPVFQILESRGFEVKLVNARYVKNVPGRKTDVQDCQWLQRLHSYGLLHGSFRPEDQICILRGYIRQRENLTRSGATHIHRMQKSLTQMNIQLHKVISDITGSTGIKIIKAILTGERDTKKLAELKDVQIKNDVAIIAKALEGDYREEHLFVLQQELESYEFYQQKIRECDIKIESCYEKFTKKDNNLPLDKIKNKSRRNHPAFNLRQELYDITGTDFTKIPGLDVLTIQTIISEVGLNMEKWQTEKHFTSWLGLCPANKITGEKIFSTKTRKVINRASTAFRIAAFATGKSKSALGGYYRRIRNRIGSPKAITATARKLLACLFYRLLKYGQSYVEQGLDYYEKIYTTKVVKNLEKKAKEFGFVLVKVDNTA